MTYTVAEYIWLDSNKKFRSKTTVIKCEKIGLVNEYPHDFPVWDYDGSSTGQADGKKSEITLRPVFVCDNPLSPAVLIDGRYKNNIRSSKLVLCETYHADGTPTKSNTRHIANKISKHTHNQKPWFGLEQEYFIFDKHIEMPYHISDNSLFGNTTQHYCGTGQHIEYRSLAEEHMLACTKAGITISGINAEVSKNQWEFQIGPAEGIRASDELLVARFLLERIAEKYCKTISYEPKPFANINGSGCHANFSTLKMRTPSCDNNDGIVEIYRVINNMEKYHKEDILHYGAGNESRLSGKHETSSYNTFSSGVGDRGASVRINNNTYEFGYGYFEDRRPAANMDPYLVTSILMKRAIDG
jgi:glutamine synthetase